MHETVWRFSPQYSFLLIQTLFLKGEHMNVRRFIGKLLGYEQEIHDLKEGQVIFLGTDGIWEAHNPEGELFGKERLYNTIRENGTKSAGKS